MGRCLALKALHEQTENASLRLGHPLVSAPLTQNGLLCERPQPASPPSFTGFLREQATEAAAI